MIVKHENHLIVGAFKIRGTRRHPSWYRHLVHDRCVGVMVSGGNVDASVFASVLEAA